ncbi:MAG TPA: hypothetical protein VNZ52_03575 [Candidatus Thermoplasmatota archaeon]|nr:hypothetical protein [Candidatus Thermoplasmatota archaeon]
MLRAVTAAFLLLTLALAPAQADPLTATFDYAGKVADATVEYADKVLGATPEYAGALLGKGTYTAQGYAAYTDRWSESDGNNSSVVVVENHCAYRLALRGEGDGNWTLLLELFESGSQVFNGELACPSALIPLPTGAPFHAPDQSPATGFNATRVWVNDGCTETVTFRSDPLLQQGAAFTYAYEWRCGEEFDASEVRGTTSGWSHLG